MRRSAPLLIVAACGNHNSTPVDARLVDNRLIDVRPDLPIDAPRTLNGFIVISNVTDGTMPISGLVAYFVEGSPFGTVTGTEGACTAYAPRF
jgi:hypothetical protein